MKLFHRQRAPRRVGDFQVLEMIGQGGMCTVYRGHQASLDRPVAVKVLNERLGSDDDSRERFERESLVIARLGHPNIVHVLDRGIMPDGAPYFVMELIEGQDLAQALAAGSLDFTAKLEVAIQVCRALAYAHKNGVIHRDIKPANILIDGEGNAKVLDFGIAKVGGGCGGEGEGSTAREGADWADGTGETSPGYGPKRAGGLSRLFGRKAATPPPITRANLVLGTVAFMSPEQMSGDQPLTAATDLYSLGVVLYEMFTGTRPVGAFRPPSAIDPALPDALDAAILQCLAPDPADRFASADQLRDRLLELLHGAHLDTGQRERAGGGLDRMQERFALLDVIREEPGGGAYLYQHRTDRRLFVIRKRTGSGGGLAESRMLGVLRHPHLAEVHGAAGDERCFIVVTEYLPGGSLRDRLVQSLPVDEAVRIGIEAAEGLGFAHKNRLVHGRVRPGNILFDASDTVKLADFGFDEHRGHAHDPYVPFGEAVSAAADVLALGVILFQAATGLFPSYRSGSLVLEPGLLKLPTEVRSLLMEMLDPDRRRRVVSCEVVAARLKEARAHLGGRGPVGQAATESRPGSWPVAGPNPGRRQA